MAKAFLKTRFLKNGREFVNANVPIGKEYDADLTLHKSLNIELDTGKQYEVVCVYVDGYSFPLELLSIPSLEN